MNSVREHIRAVIGNPKKSGIADKEIDDAAWEYYFDLDQTMDYILGLLSPYLILGRLTFSTDVQAKRNAAKERQGTVCSLIHILPSSTCGHNGLVSDDG